MATLNFILINASILFLIGSVGVFLCASLFLLALSYRNHSITRWTKEFERRVHRTLDQFPEELRGLYGFEVVQWVLKNTFFEIYTLRDQRQKRRFDKFQSQLDRFLRVQQGAQTLIDEVTYQLQYYHTLRGKRLAVPFAILTHTAFRENNAFHLFQGKWPYARMEEFIQRRHLAFGLFSLGGIFCGILLGLLHWNPADAGSFAIVRSDLLWGTVVTLTGLTSWTLTQIAAWLTPTPLLSPLETEQQFARALQLLWTHSGALGKGDSSDKLEKSTPDHPLAQAEDDPLAMLQAKNRAKLAKKAS